MGQLEGKVAAITGAGGGIGRALAKAMAAQGAAIVVNDPLRPWNDLTCLLSTMPNNLECISIFAGPWFCPLSSTGMLYWA